MMSSYFVIQTKLNEKKNTYIYIKNKFNCLQLQKNLLEMLV